MLTPATACKPSTTPSATTSCSKPLNDNGAPASLAGDFQEGGTHLGQEYGYDANGNLIQDRNKGITGIAYNHLNLPRQIHFGIGADSIVFRYTAAGQKVAKLVYQTGQPVQRTDYLGPYQYEQDSLRFFPHAEGRVLRTANTTSGAVRYQREFSFKDHLGNLRLTYRLGQVHTYTATLEQDSVTRGRERQQFDSLSVSPPVAVPTGLARTGAYAARLNAGGSAPRPLGPLTQFAVQQGDTVRATAFGLYPQATSNNAFAFSLAGFLASLLQPAPAAPAGLDGARRGGLPLLQVGLRAATLRALHQLPGDVPTGYLRVLSFTEDSVLVDQRTVQLSAAALGNYEPLGTGPLVVQHNGYVSVYVGNESAADVYFDDVTIEHRQGLQVQENQYDPFGLDLAGVSGAAPGLRGKNFYQFNGKENQRDLGLNWNHQDWRFFDYQIGRWHVVDQLAEKWHMASPYAFASNNPVLVADPDGRDNIIYLQAQKSSEQDISRKELRGIVRQANANFKELGLETRVRLAKGNVNYNKLDKTDAVAVIGRGSDVISAVDNMNKGFANELREAKFGHDGGTLDPERSQNDEHGGNIIALDSRAIKATAKEWHETSVAVGAFTINHGAGHNAGLEHGGSDQMSNGAGMLRVPASSVMTDGGEIYNSVLHLNGWGYTPGLKGLINNPSNDHGLIHESYLQRFGTNKARATLPTKQ